MRDSVCRGVVDFLVCSERHMPELGTITNKTLKKGQWQDRSARKLMARTMTTSTAMSAIMMSSIR